MVLALLRQAERSLHTQDPGRRLTVRTRESTDGVVLYVIDNDASSDCCILDVSQFDPLPVEY